MRIDPVMLRAMGEELTALKKESELEKEAFGALLAKALPALGNVGTKLLGGAQRGLGALSKSTALSGRVGSMASKAHTGLAGAVGKGVEHFGGGVQGMNRLKQVVGGGAVLGGAALGAGAVGSRLRRPRPSGYR